MKWIFARPVGLLLAAAPLILASPAAQAEARLVSASPSAGAAVGAPQTIRLQFNENLNPNLSDADLTTESGAPIPVANSASGMTITATPKTMLEPGRYEVLWRAVGSSGDRSRAVYDFVVR